MRVSQISDVEVAAFEGPLAFFKSLDLKSDTHDVSKIRNLLAHSLNKFSDNLSQDLTKEGRDALEPNMLKPRDSLSTVGHIIMTGVRAVFAESGMWVITETSPGGHTSFPTWLPMHIKGATTKYSLLYVTRGRNKWAVIGEHVLGEDGMLRYKKVGIAFVDTTPDSGQITTVEMI